MSGKAYAKRKDEDHTRIGVAHGFSVERDILRLASLFGKAKRTFH
jgi:hypothetical protein